MSDLAMFDTLAYAKRLKSAGFTEEQAEVQTEALAGIIDDKLATKQDIRDLKQDMKEMEIALKRDINEMEVRLRHDLTLRLSAMLAASMAIIATIVKLIS